MARPDYPNNKGGFLANPTGAKHRQKTLASVLEKKKAQGSAKASESNLNRSIKNSRLVQPTTIVRQDSKESLNKHQTSRPSYYTKSLQSQTQSKKVKEENSKKVIGDTGSVDINSKNQKVKPVVSRLHKGVKHTQFNLVDAKVQDSRTKTPVKEMTKKQFASTPNNKKSQLHSRKFDTVTKQKPGFSGRVGEIADLSNSMNKSLNGKFSTQQRSPNRVVHKANLSTENAKVQSKPATASRQSKGSDRLMLTTLILKFKACEDNRATL